MDVTVAESEDALVFPLGALEHVRTIGDASSTVQSPAGDVSDYCSQVCVARAALDEVAVKRLAVADDTALLAIARTLR